MAGLANTAAGAAQSGTGDRHRGYQPGGQPAWGGGRRHPPDGQRVRSPALPRPPPAPSSSLPKATPAAGSPRSGSGCWEQTWGRRAGRRHSPGLAGRAAWVGGTGGAPPAPPCSSSSRLAGRSTPGTRATKRSANRYSFNEGHTNIPFSTANTHRNHCFTSASIP